MAKAEELKTEGETMQKSAKAMFGFPYSCIIVSLIMMMWVVGAGLAGGPYTITGTVTPGAGGTITPISTG